MRSEREETRASEPGAWWRSVVRFGRERHLEVALQNLRNIFVAHAIAMHGAVLDIQQSRGRRIAMIFHQAIVDDDVGDVGYFPLHVFDTETRTGQRQVGR